MSTGSDYHPCMRHGPNSHARLWHRCLVVAGGMRGHTLFGLTVHLGSAEVFDEAYNR
jgi:hypothetical protein